MTTLRVDTVKMRECGNDIIEAADTYNTNVRNLFTRVGEVPSRTSDWEGISAINYANVVVKEKMDYVNFGNGLVALGNTLVQYADELEKAIKNNKIK